VRAAIPEPLDRLPYRFNVLGCPVNGGSGKCPRDIPILSGGRTAMRWRYGRPCGSPIVSFVLEVDTRNYKSEITRRVKHCLQYRVRTIACVLGIEIED